MKTYKKYFLLLVMIMLLGGCDIHKPLSTGAAQNNETYVVEYLFEHDGCKVYRFRDDGNYVYFTNCSGKVTSMENDSTKVQIQNLIVRD